MSRTLALGVLAIVVLFAVIGCAPGSTSTAVSTASPIAVLSPSVRASSVPTDTPEPTPIFVRFDVQNGPRQVIVWMTSDRGADARNLAPGERKTIFVPLSEGTDIEVFVDGCRQIAHIDWIPGISPATIVLANDSKGTGYVINIRDGVSGTPVPEATREDVGCSG